jgi:hypothetical protein
MSNTDLDFFPSTPSKKSAVLIDPNITMADVKKNLKTKKDTEVFYKEIIKKLEDKTTNKNTLLNELQDLRGRNGYIIPPFLKYYGDDKENVSRIIRDNNQEINDIITRLPIDQPIEIGGRKRKKRYTKKNKFINKRNNKKSKKNAIKKLNKK